VAPPLKLIAALVAEKMSRGLLGVVVAIPILPLFKILIASVAPAEPTVNLMKSVVPTPEVDRRLSEEPAAEPPVTSGTIAAVAERELIVPREVKDDDKTLNAKVVPEISEAALTVIDASGKVIVLLERVGLEITKVVLKASTVLPSKTKGDDPRIIPADKSILPPLVKLPVVKAPILAVVLKRLVDEAVPEKMVVVVALVVVERVILLKM
jgi:hypothetical protein